MKFFIITGLLIITLILFLTPLMKAVTKTEEQKYTLIVKENDFEIRFYPATTIASISSHATTYKELANPGFRKLAAYIFGANETKTNIAMTAPVHMDINDSLSSMSFVMPASYQDTKLPKPNDPNVMIKKTDDAYVATLRFGGYASDKDLKHYSEKLQQLLKEKGISTKGTYKYLGYNPPYQLLGRRNEILIAIEWNK